MKFLFSKGIVEKNVTDSKFSNSGGVIWLFDFSMSLTINNVAPTVLKGFLVLCSYN
jgi:hypothetical protein